MLKKLLPGATLLLSASTLVCCALPALFVTLGAGATLVSVLGMFPQLIWISEHKATVFTIAGACIAANFLVRYLSPAQCPADPALAAACSRAQKISGLVLYTSAGLYAIGIFFAFIAPALWP